MPPTPEGDVLREYVPGVCNIGPWESRRRLASGIAGLGIAGVLLVALIAVGAPPIARVLVLVPAWGGAFSVLQARRRFCGGYALRRIANFGDTHETVRSVTDEAAHRADMAALGRLTRDSFLIGLALTVVAVLLPI
ncbi:MAG TPA: hypothetical protein VIR16_02815 [Candidatus Limnocylindrales bacterium]